MAIDFPNSPSSNQVHTVGTTSWIYSDSRWELVRYGTVGPTGPTGANGAGLWTVSDTAPTGPSSGSTWYNSTTGKTYVYYDSYWVEVGNTGQITTSHSNSHINGGGDAMDGDRLQLDYVPTNYTRNSAATGATDARDLTAHINGIDSKLGLYTSGTNFPNAPATGTLWYDTSVSTLKVYNGTAWVYTVPSGSVVQTVTVRSDARNTYSAANSGNGTTVPVLNLTITPRFASSTIICDWMINGEMHQDSTFLIHKDGALVTTAGNTGYNSAVGNIRSSGMMSAFYDQNEDSTPSNWKLLYIDSTTLSTASRTYAPAVRGSGASNWTLALNRTLNGSTGDNYESMVSIGVAMEIAA